MSTLAFVRRCIWLFVFPLSLLRTALCQTGVTGYNYVLDTEYSGANFFNGWEFYAAGDPTNGFVQYVDQQTALSYGMIKSSDTAPVYIGVDYVNKFIPGNNGAGRPSVRISTTKVWTHGLFVGDFAHAPGGICGTWPAWWTLGPNWPYTGEIDILEGVNLLTTNAMSLHTSPNYTIAGDPTTQTGLLQSTNCAYYQGGGNGVGCGVVDPRNTSYGAGFNAIGGGVYAMQWTSDFIKVWFFPRSQIPADITNKKPDPSTWGLPAADLIGGGDNIDEHFVDHAIVFDNTFCGDYAGSPYVWNNTGQPSISCAAITGYSTCSKFVGAQPGAFVDSYWSINSVRVYQLEDTSSAPSSTSSTSLTPTFTPATSTAPVPTATSSLCPKYNFTEVSFFGRTYEIECGFTFNGDDLGHPYPSYPEPQNFEECINMCNYWTTHNSTTCIGVAYVLSTKGCYPKDRNGGNQLNIGQDAARLIWAGYGDITDQPRTATTSTAAPSAASSSDFSTVTPVHYVDPTVAPSSVSLSTARPQSSILGGGMGLSLTSSYQSSLASLSSSAIFSSSVPASSSASSASSLRPSSSALSSSSIPMSSSTPVSSSISLSSSTRQLSSTTSSSSLAFSISLPLSVSLPLSISVAASSSSLSSSQMAASSSRLSSTSSQASSSVHTSSSPQSSSTHASYSLSLPVSIPSLPILAPSSSASPSPMSSAMSSSLNVPSSSTSASSSAVPTSSVVPAASSASSTLTSASSSPISSLPTSSSSSSLTPLASSSISSVSTPTPPSSTTSAPVSTSTSTSSNNGPVTGIVEITLSSTSTTTSSNNGPFTGIVEVTLSPTASPSPPAPTDEGDAYAGCLGYAIGNTAFTLFEVSPAMKVEQCLSDCFEAFYAGISGEACYCGTLLNATAGLTKYPESDCNIPCPGDPAETCGGNFANEMSRRRQSLILLTTYNITVNIIAAEPPSSTPSSVAPSSTPAGVPGSSIVSPSASAPSISGAPGAGGVPSSVGPVGGSHFFDPGTSSTTLPVSVSGSSSIPVVISTVWIDVCDICEHGVTTMTTTITTLHCGCTDTPAPTVPMTTTTKACAVCGEGGAPSSLAVAAPDTSAIAAASAVASLPAVTASVSSGPDSGSGSAAYAEAAAAASAGASAGAESGSGSGSGSGSAPGSGGRLGPTYSNSTSLRNRTANLNPPEAAPAPSADVPLMTNSAAASGSFGVPLVGGAGGGISTVNASVAGPSETFVLESKNDAAAVEAVGGLFGRVLLALLVVGGGGGAVDVE